MGKAHLILAAAVFVAAGCGSSTTETSAPPTSTTETSAPPTSLAASPYDAYLTLAEQLGGRVIGRSAGAGKVAHQCATFGKAAEQPTWR